jgi:hypothetical protein
MPFSHSLASSATQAVYSSTEQYTLCEKGSIGTTIMLPRFLRNAGYQQIRHMMFALEVSAGTEAYADFYRNSEITYLLAKPFFINTGVTTEEEFDRTYQQMLIELGSDDFTGMWHYMTALGVKPLS